MEYVFQKISNVKIGPDEPKTASGQVRFKLIPIESKKFESWNWNLVIKIYIKYESEIEIMREILVKIHFNISKFYILVILLLLHYVN